MIIKILQWNIWHEEDPHAVAEYLKEIKPDIACLQEVKVQNWESKYDSTPQLLSSALGNAQFYYKSAQTWHTKDGDKSQGNMIISKHPILNTFYEYVQGPFEVSTDYSQEGRVYVEATISVDDSKLTIGTTHLSYTHRFEATPAKEIEENKLIKLALQKPDRYILTGDFNATPSSRIVSELNKNMVSAGPDFKQNTWTTKPFNYGGFQEDKLSWRLDHVFTAKDIAVHKSEILATKLSDHLPILVELEV